MILWMIGHPYVWPCIVIALGWLMYKGEAEKKRKALELEAQRHKETIAALKGRK